MSLTIRPGFNEWLIAVRADLGWSQARVLRQMQQTGAQLLSGFQGPLVWGYHYGDEGHTHWSWAIGNARPFEAMSADLGDTNPSPLGGGESMGTRPEPIVAYLGAGPYWWIDCWIFWRGPEQTVDEWPVAYPTDPILGVPLPLSRPLAVLDVPLFGRAQHHSEDVTYGDVLGRRIQREIEITEHDIAENIPTPQKNPLPFVLVGGVLVLAAGVLISKIGDR